MTARWSRRGATPSSSRSVASMPGYGRASLEASSRPTRTRRPRTSSRRRPRTRISRRPNERRKTMSRHGSVIGIKAEHIAEYKRLHAAVWPDVLRQIKDSKISNYSIYLREPENLMFSYFEYTGSDFAG